MMNQSYLSNLFGRWRAKIEQLRKVQELPTPWEVYPDIPYGSVGWRMGSGEDVMADWQCWIRSLNSEQRADYQHKHPEPEQWRGVYEMAFERDPIGIPNGVGGDAYWDAIVEHLKKQLENPKLEAFYREIAKLPNESSAENYKNFLAVLKSFTEDETNR